MEMEDDALPSFRTAMSISRSNPLRARCVEYWAFSLFNRHAFSRQLDALEQSILYFMEAIFLPHALDSEGKPIDIVKMFYFLAGAIFTCTNEYHDRQPEDVKHCMMFFCFFWINLSVPRGTEPHVALLVWIHACCVINENMGCNYAAFSPMASVAILS